MTKQLTRKSPFNFNKQLIFECIYSNGTAFSERLSFWIYCYSVGGENRSTLEFIEIDKVCESIMRLCWHLLLLLLLLLLLDCLCNVKLCVCVFFPLNCHSKHMQIQLDQFNLLPKWRNSMQSLCLFVCRDNVVFSFAIITNPIFWFFVCTHAHNSML